MNIHTPAGLDTSIDHLESGTSIILADMGAGSGQVASEWFDAMYEDVSATGARFTAVGVITPDPASVESVLSWANCLQDRVQYVVVQNATSPKSNFSAALALGFFLGRWFASVPKVASGTPGTSPLQQLPMQTAPQLQVIPQRSGKVR